VSSRFERRLLAVLLGIAASILLIGVSISAAEALARVLTRNGESLTPGGVRWRDLLRVSESNALRPRP